MDTRSWAPLREILILGNDSIPKWSEGRERHEHGKRGTRFFEKLNPKHLESRKGGSAPESHKNFNRVPISLHTFNEIVGPDFLFPLIILYQCIIHGLVVESLSWQDGHFFKLTNPTTFFLS
jgi:hypothetical protein